MVDENGITIVNEICKSVSGTISDKEGLFLYELAKDAKNGVIVEIGADKGRSTICLAMGSKAGNKVRVYSIDPHAGGMCTPDPTSGDVTSSGTPDVRYYVGQGRDAKPYLDNIKKFGVDDIVVPIIDYSELAYEYSSLIDVNCKTKMWDLPICLLWIDGDHRFNYVKKDIDLWAKHVIPGGKIVFHDYAYLGVREAIGQLIFGNLRYVNFKSIGVEEIANVTVR